MSRGGGEQLVDQEVLDRVQAIAGERGVEVLAVLNVQQGVHPFRVFAFVETQGQTAAIVTSMYWGQVQEKRVAEISRTDFEGVVAVVEAHSECSTGALQEALFGTVLVRWEAGLQSTCDSGWGTEEAQAVWPLLAEILERSRVVYQHD